MPPQITLRQRIKGLVLPTQVPGFFRREPNCRIQYLLPIVLVLYAQPTPIGLQLMVSMIQGTDGRMVSPLINGLKEVRYKRPLLAPSSPFDVSSDSRERLTFPSAVELRH